MHLWAHLQGGEAMGRCPFRATRPGGCRSGDHIHEAVTASPRTRPKRSPQGHGLLPNQQRTDALRPVRSEEHTSELQSRLHLVCRLLLEKKKKKITTSINKQSTIENSLTITLVCTLTCSFIDTPTVLCTTTVITRQHE